MAAITSDIGSNGPRIALPTDSRRKRTLTSALPVTPGGVTTTYFYRATNGTRGSTTSVGSIPGGAVVERIASS